MDFPSQDPISNLLKRSLSGSKKGPSSAANDAEDVGPDLSKVERTHPTSQPKLQGIQLQIKIPPHPGTVHCFVYTQGKVWVGCGDGSLLIYDAASGDLLESKETGQKGMNSLIVFGKFVWSGHKDGAIRLWTIRVSLPLFFAFASASWLSSWSVSEERVE